MPAASYGLHIEVSEGVSPVDAEALEALLTRVLESESVEPGAGLSLLLADDGTLRELNRAHRGIDAPTDVLSFGAEEGEATPRPEPGPRYLGDIAVSVEAVRRQAAAAALAPGVELAHVVLHGALHLLGYDHETTEDDGRMREKEESLLGPAIHARARHSDD